jgi:hypothetical protein
VKRESAAERAAAVSREMELYCVEHPGSPAAVRRPQISMRGGTCVARTRTIGMTTCRGGKQMPQADGLADPAGDRGGTAGRFGTGCCSTRSAEEGLRVTGSGDRVRRPSSPPVAVPHDPARCGSAVRAIVAPA